MGQLSLPPASGVRRATVLSASSSARALPDGRVTAQPVEPGPRRLEGTYTDADGNYHFRTVRPLGYSIPMDGPVGEMVKLQNRAGMRPSHIHCLISADGHRELVTALYFGDDPNIDSDTVFGVSQSLVVDAHEDPASPVPGLRAVHYDFRLAKAAPGVRSVDDELQLK